MIPKDPVNITLSSQEIRNIQEKARRRQILREYVIKETSNPYRHGYMTGPLEDVAMIRAEAQSGFLSEVKYFRPNVKTFAYFFGLIILPVGLLTWQSVKDSEQFEAVVRTGQISYRDRKAKFV